VVATSGTAFTAEHIQALKRYTDVLHFAFDGDSAGLKAAQSATQEAVAEGLRVATVLFPAGQDPADVAKENPEKAKECVQQPIPLVNVLLQRLQEADDAAERETLLKSILPFIRTVTNIVQQGEMIQTLANSLHVPESTIHEELAKIPRVPVQHPQTAAVPDAGTYTLGPEQLLLGILIDNAEARANIFPYIEEDFLIDPIARDVFGELTRIATGNNAFLSLSPNDILNALPEHQLPQIEGIRQLAQEHCSHSSLSPAQEARLLLRTLTKRSLQKRLDLLQRKLSDNGLTDRSKSLREFQDLAERLASVEIDR
jgi:DNA primase